MKIQQSRIIRRLHIIWWNVRYYLITRHRFDPKVHLPACGWASLAFMLFLTTAIISFGQRGVADNSGQYAASDVLGEFNAVSGSSFITPTNQYGMGANGVIVDTVHHRLFVDDGSNSRILIYMLNNSNQLTSNIPNFVLGWPDLTTNQYSEYGTQPTTQSSIANSIGMAYDSANQYLFVTDAAEDRVLVFNLSGTVSNGMNAAFELGEPDFTTNANTDLCNGGSVSSTTLRDPVALVYDSANKQLFVADGCDNRVVDFDLSSGISNGMAASHVLGEPNLSTGAGGTSQTTMQAATGLAYDQADQLLFASDGTIGAGGGNNRVLVYDLSGGIADGMAASHVLGQTNFTNSSGALSATGLQDPKGLTYDAGSQQLFVADSGNNRVLDFNLAGGIADGMAASHVLGSTDFTSTNSNVSPVVSQDLLYQPGAVTYDAANRLLYVADTGNSRIMVFNLAGGIADGMAASSELGQTDFNGNSTFTSGGFNDYGHYLNQFVSQPAGTAIDTVGHRLFVSDSGNDRIMIYSLDSSNNFTNHVATHVLGQPDFVTVMGSNPTIAQNTIGCPGNMAYDSSRQYLFVDDSCANRVLVYDLSGGISDGMAASFVLGQTTFGASGANLTQNGFNSPLLGGLAYDPATHYLYVGDDRNHRVMIFDTTALSDGMNATDVIGQPNFGSNATNVSQTGLSTPIGMALDSQHHQLFVADSGLAGRVLVYNTASLASGMPASFVLGETGFNVHNSAADTGGTPDANSFSPGGLAYDTNNQRLFVEDDYANRTLSFDLAGGIANNMAASAVIGEPDFATSTSPTSVNKYNFLFPVGGSDAYDPTTNRLYLTDGFNSRIMVFSIANLADTNTSPAVGDTYNQALGSQTQGIVTFGMASGALPPGLAFDTSTGILSGTVTTPGMYNFTLTAQDNNGLIGLFTDAKAYTVVVGTNSGSGGSSGGSSSNVGGSSGGSSASQTGGTVSAPQTVVTSPSGLVVTINLADGQTIPQSGYTVTFTPAANQTVDLKQVSAYVGGQLVDTVTPDSSGIARWDWRPDTSGPADLRFVITDSLGRQTTQAFSVTVGASRVVLVQRAATPRPIKKSGAGILDTLANFVASLPNAMVQYFPYFLIILLFIDAAILARRAMREVAEWHLQQKLFEQAKNVNLLKITFVQLASHYLRTPVTIIKGGAELLTADPSAAKTATQLMASAEDLADCIEPILLDASANSNDPTAMFVGAEAPSHHIMLQPAVLVPILLIGVVCLMFDYLVKRAHTFSLSTVSLVEQAILFSIGVLLLYSAYRYFILKRRDNKEMKGILRSEQMLGQSRDKLISDAAETLMTKLELFGAAAAKITDAAARKIVQGGVDSLNKVLHKFQVAKLLQGTRSTGTVSAIDISEVVEPITKKRSPDLDKNNLSCNVTGEGTVHTRNVELMRYVLESLIDNSIAYRRESPGEIIIKAAHNSLTVADNGVGIPKDKLSLLFQPFFKAEGALDFSHAGMGFSLYLDKLIMNYVGGNISISSVQDEGTTVTLALPQ